MQDTGTPEGDSPHVEGGRRSWPHTPRAGRQSSGGGRSSGRPAPQEGEGLLDGECGGRGGGRALAPSPGGRLHAPRDGGFLRGTGRSGEDIYIVCDSLTKAATAESVRVPGPDHWLWPTWETNCVQQ